MKKLKKVFLVTTITVMCAMVSVGLISPKNTTYAQASNGDNMTTVSIDDMWIGDKLEDASKVYKLPVEVSYDKMIADLSDDGTLDIEEILYKVYPDLVIPGNKVVDLMCFRNYYNSLDIINYYYCKFLQEDGSTDILVNNNFLDTFKEILEICEYQPLIHCFWSLNPYKSFVSNINILKTLEKYVISRGYKIDVKNFLLGRNFIAYKNAIKAGKPLFIEMDGMHTYEGKEYYTDICYTADTMYNGFLNKKLRFNSSLMEGKYKTDHVVLGVSIFFEFNSVNIYSDAFESVNGSSVEIYK